MEQRILALLAAFATLGGIAVPRARARSWRWDGHLTIEGGRDAQRCSDLKPRASAQLSQSTEDFTVLKSQAPALEVHTDSHTSVHARGWNRPEYSVEVCKFATAATRSAADQVLQSIAISHNAGRFTITGPDRDDGWQAVVFVHAPKEAVLDFDSRNAPIDASEITGKLTVRAVNGPLSLDRCSGTIDAETTNGPISMAGGGGSVRLRASNGPISLKLTGAAWSGSGLEARTESGPVNVVVPVGFSSGLRIETSGPGPISCSADACRNARTEGGRFFPTLIQAGSGDVIRLSTHNGPVSVSNSGRRARLI